MLINERVVVEDDGILADRASDALVDGKPVALVLLVLDDLVGVGGLQVGKSGLAVEDQDDLVRRLGFVGVFPDGPDTMARVVKQAVIVQLGRDDD